MGAVTGSVALEVGRMESAKSLANGNSSAVGVFRINIKTERPEAGPHDLRGMFAIIVQARACPILMIGGNRLMIMSYLPPTERAAK
jgi:hypothetical protein